MLPVSLTDVGALLPTVRVPTLVVQHADDPLIPPESGRYIADHIPDAKYVELPGRNRLPFVEPGWRESFQEIAEFLTGEQAEVADDRVLSTVLFTDIVDSTRRAAEMGDRDWHALLDAHDAVVRSQLARFRGREVNTSGDSFLATFDGPQRAIRCAMAIRDTVQALGIQVRAGLHTGECEVRGEDIGGIGVHIGARVSALAGPNQVLVSSTLRDLVIGSGLEFEDRGAHQLKGVPGEMAAVCRHLCLKALRRFRTATGRRRSSGARGSGGRSSPGCAQVAEQQRAARASSPPRPEAPNAHNRMRQ